MTLSSIASHDANFCTSNFGVIICFSGSLHASTGVHPDGTSHGVGNAWHSEVALFSAYCIIWTQTRSAAWVDMTLSHRVMRRARVRYIIEKKVRIYVRRILISFVTKIIIYQKPARDTSFHFYSGTLLRLLSIYPKAYYIYELRILRVHPGETNVIHYHIRYFHL